jgi:hypothetical protein
MEQLHPKSMQPSKLNAKPNLVIDQDLSMSEPVSDPTESDESSEPATGKLLADSIEQGKTLLNEHKGKLAIGVAATLGLMVFYKWREKKLAEEDPEEYARLQRIKAVVREEEINGQPADKDTDKQE